jgi:hypothetical protein
MSTEPALSDDTKVHAADPANAALETASSKHSASMRAQNPDTSDFFRLPIELRSKIYTLAFGTEPLYFEYQPHRVGIGELYPIVMAAALSYDHEYLPLERWVASKSQGIIDWICFFVFRRLHMCPVA